MRTNLYPVSHEGWKYIAYAALAFILFSIFDIDFFQFLSLGSLLFFIVVFRNPEREAPLFEEFSVVSPVDGLVVSIEELQDKEYSYKVKIESNYLDVSVLRVPLKSSIRSIELKKGARLSSSNPLFEKINEYCALTLEDKNSNKIKVVHRLKQSFDSIHIDAFVNQTRLQGGRYGVMLNGVTTLYLPLNFRLNVNVGNQVKASETLVGYFS